MNEVASWFRRVFADPQLLLLTALLVVAAITTTFFAPMFAPAIAAVVIAFLLDGPAEALKRYGVPHTSATAAVFLVFLLLVSVFLIVVLPPLLVQIVAFINDSPAMVGEVRVALAAFQSRFPDLISEAQLQDWFNLLGNEIAALGPDVVAFSITGLTGAVTLIIYFILVPLMVFFFLRDKRKILAWFGSFLPDERPALEQIWVEVTTKAGDYARGKVYEIVIVTAVSLVGFHLVGLQYATLLAVITGFSVLIPYIGAAAASVPVFLVSFFQFGWTVDMGWAVALYFIIQAFDGNLLNPLLFSGVMKLHPNAIIMAILFFGRIWGFWGLFFAIPLATVINAVLRAWKASQEKPLPG